MNKNEFIHRAIIAQMANPHAFGSDNNPFLLSPSDIIDKARDMADYVEQEGISFDPVPEGYGYVHTPLGDFRISVDKEQPSIKDIDYCIERYKEMLRDAPQEFNEIEDGREWLNFVRAKLAKLQEKRDKLMNK